jgi:hypothetical protein
MGDLHVPAGERAFGWLQTTLSDTDANNNVRMEFIIC